MKKIYRSILGILAICLFFGCTSQPWPKYGYFINEQDADPTGGTNTVRLDEIQLVPYGRGTIGIKFKVTNISSNSITILLRESLIIHGDIRDNLVLGNDKWNTYEKGPSDYLIEGNDDKYINSFEATVYPKSRCRVYGGDINDHSPMKEPFSLLLYFEESGTGTKHRLAIDFVRVEDQSPASSSEPPQALP